MMGFKLDIFIMLSILAILLGATHFGYMAKGEFVIGVILDMWGFMLCSKDNACGRR